MKLETRILKYNHYKKVQLLKKKRKKIRFLKDVNTVEVAGPLQPLELVHKRVDKTEVWR